MILRSKNLKLTRLKAAVSAVCICFAVLQFSGCAAETRGARVTVSLSSESISLPAGYTQSLSATAKADGKASAAPLRWKSDNPSVAKVDANGMVTAVAAGQCSVTCSAGTAKARCSVTVTPSCNWTTVLMYHSLNAVGNKLRVPPADFDTEMKWLHDNLYKSLTMDELYGYISSKKPFPEKTVVITFDDGYVDAYDSGFPIIKKYNLHATVFMISSYIGKKYFLSADQIKEMSDSGYFDFEDHTVTHPDLDTLSHDEQYSELSDSKQTLEALTGKKVEYLAYPSGRYNQDTVSIAKSLGYKMCFKMEGGSGTLESSPYEFPRAFVDKHLNTLIDAVNGLGY